MTLRLLTLGAPLELLREDGRPIHLGNSKHLALLTYLALEPGEYARTFLTKLIWQSGDSAGSFNNALFSLREVFGEEVFPKHTQRISFDPSLVACDTSEFLRAGTHLDDRDARHTALALYRGPFFEDFNTRGASDRYAKWMEDKRAELERLFIAVCERECEQLESKQRWEELAETARQAGRKAPSWEKAHEWLRLTEQKLRPQSEMEREIPSGAERGAGVREPSRRTLFVLLAAALVLFALAAVWYWSRSRTPSPPGIPKGSSVAAIPVCKPGTATAQLVEEVFWYGVRVKPGRAFAKGWKLQNTGDCAWDTNFRLHRVSNGPPLSTTLLDVPLRRSVPPGDTIWLVLPMRAPTEPNRYEEVWELRDAHDRPVRVGEKSNLVAMIRVYPRYSPSCPARQGSAVLIAKKYPDGTVRPNGEDFRFSWTLKNGSECAWGLGTRLRYVSSSPNRLSQQDSVITDRSIEPGETYTFLVPMRLRGGVGPYHETWELRSGSGTVIPIDSLPTTTVQLRVQSPDVPLTAAPVCPSGSAQLRFLDENWPDSSIVRPGQEFVKRWTVMNSGTCAWPANYELRHSSSPNGQLARSTAPRPLAEIVPPGASYTFEVPMRAPRKPNFYVENWQFVDERGNRIGIGTAPYLAALITVEEARR